MNELSQKDFKKYFRREMDGNGRESVMSFFKEESFIFTSTIEEISKKFLSLVFQKNIFEMNFENIIKLCLQEIKDEELTEEFPKNEKDFYDYISYEYLMINDEPRKVFIEISIEASEDLQLINNNIDKIEEQIRTNEEKIPKPSYEIKRLEYYKQKNIKAKEEIVQFISNNLKSYSYNESSVISGLFINSILFRSIPYSFSKRNPFFPKKNRDSYDPDSFSEFENKFLQLDLKEYIRFISDHKNGLLSKKRN